MVALEDVASRIDVRLETVHYQPQQSVLNPQDGHRQTACMRNISAPQRSQITLSEAASGVLGEDGRGGGVGFDGSDISGRL